MTLTAMLAWFGWRRGGGFQRDVGPKGDGGGGDVFLDCEDGEKKEEKSAKA